MQFKLFIKTGIVEQKNADRFNRLLTITFGASNPIQKKL
jgi:hypothetical protein